MMAWPEVAFPLRSPKGKPAAFSPLVRCGEDPEAPAGCLLPDACSGGGPRLTRIVSGASTDVPEGPAVDELDEESWTFTRWLTEDFEVPASPEPPRLLSELAQQARYEVLEGKLEEVKALYRQRCGKSVDEDTVEEGGRSLWIKTTADGSTIELEAAARGPAPSLEALEARLAEVKELYRERYGRDVDADSEPDAEEVYRQKYRRDVDAYSEPDEEDGPCWIVIDATTA